MGRCTIFDMDGLLFDTESLGVDISIMAGKEQGVNLSRNLVFGTLGTSGLQTRRKYEEAHPLFDSVRFMKVHKALMLEDVVRNGMRVKSYARECVMAYRNAGFVTALATANSSEVVAYYLDKAGMSEYFDVLVCGDSGLPSKPAPDIFLHAAALAGIPPAECVVLEDSPNGLKAAKAAGMRVYMVPDLVPYDDSLQPSCDGVLNHLGEAITLIRTTLCH